MDLKDTNFAVASKELNLTPQEQNLYEHHANNLGTSNQVLQPDGSVSTVLQAVVTGPDGRFYNIPTVWGGTAYDPGTAMLYATQAGLDRYPSYSTPEEADKRYEKMHVYMDKDVGKYLKDKQKNSQ